MILLLLVLSIFSVLGSYLFTFDYYLNKNSFDNYNENFNFNNFYHSFLLVFRTTTGEDWPSILKELVNCNIFNVVDKNSVSPIVTYIFFFAMNFCTNLIMMNLFLLVTLNQYDEFINKTENPIEKFRKITTAFKNSWKLYSSNLDMGHRIKKINLNDFIMTFNIEFLEKVKDSIDNCNKYIFELNVHV